MCGCSVYVRSELGPVCLFILVLVVCFYLFSVGCCLPDIHLVDTLVCRLL